MGTQGPKKPNWLVLGAFGGSGEALSWGKKAKLPIGQLKRLSCPLDNLAHIPNRLALSQMPGTGYILAASQQRAQTFCASRRKSSKSLPLPTQK